ncbi:Probable lipid-A-disaccharide synthase-mitochondrial [Striga hermonthica]|uniref:lipid-A-disaccharide synthase n=1 Tax=Striga hermonthica TaxID=68872 RepID=A0A9N7R6W6_STRHE|nr:Probable lipid-A-disaccharide synthase-mitochondrial [Striga hermonthica]
MFSTSVRSVEICMNRSFLQLVKRSLSVSSRDSVRGLASKDGELRVFIVAGEVSGDIIASRFINSLNKLSPFPVRFAGVGGLNMSRHGFNSLFPMEDIAVMGIWELLPHLSTFRVKLQETVEAALGFHPHVVLTVDSKGFSFRFLKQLRERHGLQRLACLRHFHYVAPSFWAWRGGESRLQRLSEFVDHVFCILPFEAEVCRSIGLDATFVGHPTLEDALELKIEKYVDEELKVQGDGKKFRRTHGISPESTIISVLPGSRLQEVTRMFPIFSQTMVLLKDAFSKLTAVIHVAPNKHVEEYISSAVRQWPVSAILVPGGSSCMKYDSFSASRVALCASGTVAVELQLARLPCVVAYRAHILTEWFIRYKARIPHISLPNIIFDSPIIPEALFGACTPSRLALLLVELMHDESLRHKQLSTAGQFLNLLHPQRRLTDNLNQSESILALRTPSMIAASAVLNS